MINLQQAVLFINLQKYLYGLGREQFTEFARGAWPNYWEHMCEKWYDQCDQNPWEFCCRLDPIALENMLLYYNKRVRGVQHLY